MVTLNWLVGIIAIVAVFMTLVLYAVGVMLEHIRNELRGINKSILILSGKMDKTETDGWSEK